MAEYCTVAALTDLLTPTGLLYVADRDDDGAVGPSEQTAYVEAAIARAGMRIDFALCDQVDTATARAPANAFLSRLALDLAAYEVCRTAGGNVPESFKAGKEEADEMLDRIAAGARVPGLAYPSQTDGRLGLVRSQPMVVNY